MNNDRMLFLCNRFERALLKYQPALPPARRFMALDLPDRLAVLVKLSLIGGAVSPDLASLVENAVEGRRVVHRSYPQFGVAAFQIAYQVRREDYRIMPPFQGRQVVIYGGTGGGKSTAIKHLLKGRPGTVIVIDPHYQRGSGQWHSRWLIAGAGGRFDEIAAVIDLVHAETQRRIQSIQAAGAHQPLHLAIDELSTLLADLPADSIQQLYAIVRQGRKYNVFVILTPHSIEVKEMGLEGSGGQRENFLFVRMPRIRPGEEQKPRIVDIFLGNPLRSPNPDGRYLIPPPTIYQGEPRLITPLELAALLPSPLGEGVSRASLGRGEVGPTSGPAPDAPEPYHQRYASGTAAASDLAHFLAQRGYGIRKIAQALPFRTEDARTIASLALSAITYQHPRPMRESIDETDLVRELHTTWGMPANRIARLLDGPDHRNLPRVQSLLSSDSPSPILRSKMGEGREGVGSADNANYQYTPPPPFREEAGR